MTWPSSSPTSRGYGWEWRKLREAILKRDGYICHCDDCKGGEIRVTPANQVDHIVSKAKWLELHGNLDKVDDPSNLRAINRDCHEKKSLAEKGQRYNHGCDVNGFPLDPNHPWTRR